MHSVVYSAWGAVLVRYGEDAVIGKDASVAIDEGAGCCAMLGAAVEEEAGLLR